MGLDTVRWHDPNVQGLYTYDMITTDILVVELDTVWSESLRKFRLGPIVLP